jgi:hypothetical protein
MKNNSLLILGIGLLLFGFLGNVDWTSVSPINNAVQLESYVVDPPSDPEILKQCDIVIEIFKAFNDSTKKRDALKLSALYNDIATLIELDGENTIIKDTNAVRKANSLSGQMLRLDIKDKYPGLAQANQNVINVAIGNDDVLLDAENRAKASQAFRALSWACYEGSK